MRNAGLLAYCLILGLYLTLRGYHSLDGDQAYRLPLLLHAQGPSVFADDPFVRAFDAFNPHRGSLLLLGWATGILGLSGGLLTLFVATFLATCRGIDRLAREVWPGWAAFVGWVAVILVLTAKAGNIGTNHLFEAMVLDRLMALAAGWWAVAAVVGPAEQGWWRAAIALALAAFIHPSLGLQLAIVVAGSWIAWAAAGGRARVPWDLAARGVVAAGLAVLPGLALNLTAGGSLEGGLSAQDFWTLAVELQNPQHMLPHLWRMPQWLAWGAYLVLATLAVARLWDGHSCPSRQPTVPAEAISRIRLVIMLAVVLAWLALAWVAIEVVHDPRMTIFQPFRMATVARGLALVLIAGRLVDLWSHGGWFHRTRAVLIGVALAGDWMFVVVTLAELGATLVERAGERAGQLVYGGLMAWGLFFLSRHDTESGHWPILLVLIGSLFVRALGSDRWAMPTLQNLIAARPALVLAVAWIVPTLALLTGGLAADSPLTRTAFARGLIARCRFTAVPIDDFERLGVWCRDHTPPGARFIGPPGPKTFRLWSRRSLAFNRSGSPYQAAGLADWFARFQDHVDLHVPPGGIRPPVRGGTAPDRGPL